MSMEFTARRVAEYHQASLQGHAQSQHSCSRKALSRHEQLMPKRKKLHVTLSASGVGRSDLAS